MFKPIVHDTFASDDQTTCDAPKVNLLADIVNNQIRNAFVHDIRVTDEETKELQKMFKRQLVYMNTDPSVVYRNSSHPILTVLNDYANADAASQIRHLKNKGFSTLSIGDSINPKIKAHHNCLLLNCDREAMRYVQTGLTNNSIIQQEYVKLAQNNKYKSLVCHNGAQNCNFEATIGFAIHSTYDITLDQLYEIFDQHKLSKLIIYAYVPLLLYDNDLSQLDQKYQHYKLFEADDKLMFHMGDYSLNYVHSYSNWKKFANFTRIKGADFHIIRETSRVIGPLHIITLSKVANYGGEIIFSVPITEMYNDLYKVPSMSHVIKGNFILKQSEVHHYLVPKHVVDVLLSYAIRASDEGYKFPELATVASGLLRSIRIGAVTYQDRWNVGVRAYNDILMSIFLIGALKRADRTSGISTVFKFLKTWKGSCSIFYDFRQTVLRMCSYFDKNSKEHNRLHYTDISDAHNIWDFDILELQDVHISNDHIIVKKMSKIFTDTFNNIFPNNEQWHNCNKPSPPNAIMEDDYTTSELFNDAKHTTNLVNQLNNLVINSTEDDLLSVHVNDDKSCSITSSQIEMEEIIYNKLNDNNNDCETTTLFSIDSLTTSETETQLSLDQINDNIINNNDPNEILVAKAIIPHSFITGHCAMQAVWNTFRQHIKPKQHDFIRNMYKQLMRYANMQHKLCTMRHIISVEQVESYIVNGCYEDNDCSLIVLMLLAHEYNKHVVIYDLTNSAAAPIIEFNKSGELLNIYYKDSHYSNLRGGASDKFSALYNAIIFLHGEPNNVIELSCAPGHLIDHISKTHPNTYITGLVYKNGLKLAIKNDHVNYKYYNSYDTIVNALETVAYDLIICDAARSVNSESLITQILEHVILPEIDFDLTLVVKTFANINKLYQLACHFNNITVHMTGVGTERYFIMNGWNIKPVKSLIEIWATFSIKETTHVIPFDLSRMEAFSKKHFTGNYKKFREFFNYDSSVKRRGKNYVINFNAITGYPSASKTTNCIEAYKNATYIAPSKSLSIKHNRAGVASYTPHTIFEAIFKNKEIREIVIDEISQFPIEYIMMINVMAPNAKIIVLGDIYQIPHVNYNDNKHYETVKDYGVINNLFNVYKIPQDICSIINNKFGYIMKTLSDVKEGLCMYTGPIISLIKHKFIAFNDATVKDLIQQGFDATTITTYAGSRSDVVVFYIDGKSVLSQMNNKGEWIYTALTRATNKLIVAGDVEYLSKYLSIDHTKIPTYAEYNKIYFHHDKILDIIENERADIRVIQNTEHLSNSINVSETVANMICTKAVQTVNEATAPSAFLQPLELPVIQSGVLKVNLDTLLHTHRTFKGSKLIPEVQLVKSQVSNDTKETTRCLIKRYSKKLPFMAEKRINITANLLIDALAKSIFGNCPKRVRKLHSSMLATEKEMMKYGIDYMTSLQDKLNHKPNLINELQEEFNEFSETLTFAMKRQTKFDPKIGFDSSDKVGQGVAAMSKKVNILMGAYARFMMDRIRDLFIKQGKKIILATHDSDANLNDLYTATYDSCDPKITSWLLNDFSEWDSSVRTCMIKLTEWLLIASGCPEWLATWFTLNRTAWTMVYFNKLGKTYLRGTETQFSGNPFTIFENTTIDLALMFLLYDFDKIQMAMFKGDDSAVRCANATFTPYASRIIKELGIGLKPCVTTIGEFAGYFLTEFGLFPDVLRYACKFISKLYRDEEHFNEALTSLQERCSVVKNETQKRTGAIMTSIHYPDISPEDALTLFDFLKSSRNVKYSKLVCVTQPVLSDGLNK